MEDRPDLTSDKAEIENLLRHRGWTIYEAEVKKEIESFISSLVTKNDEELRGKIKGMRIAIEAIPQRIINKNKEV